ncbi:unnamed protein product, partial [Toxocara canis]|uniref:Ubiquitin-like domain-containing protein n=1 Tax=Toxocara canis TaxID=6265 RepID=A0A183U4E7_TOXCA
HEFPVGRSIEEPFPQRRTFVDDHDGDPEGQKRKFLQRKNRAIAGAWHTWTFASDTSKRQRKHDDLFQNTISLQLHAIWRMAEQIFLRTLDDRTITLEVSPVTTVEELKEIVAQREHVDVDEQRLLFEGYS